MKSMRKVCRKFHYCLGYVKGFIKAPVCGLKLVKRFQKHKKRKANKR